MNKKRNIIVIVLIVALLALYFIYFQRIDIPFIKYYAKQTKNYQQIHPLTNLVAYVTAYIIFAILPLPGETILNILGGYIYGTLNGTLLALSASSAGATITFLLTRHSIGATIKKYYYSHYEDFFNHLKKQGKFYLLGIRLLPTTPSFLDNFIAGLMPISIPDYLITTIIGIFPVTLLTVRAGEKLNELTTLKDIISPEWFIILFSLTALCFIPPIIKILRNHRLFTQRK